MRLLVLADIDISHWEWEEGTADVVVACGDVSDDLILEAADAYSCSNIVAVKGNHDSNTAFPTPVTDLHLKTANIGGVTFGGFNGAWRYKPRGYFLYEQEEVRKCLSDFPSVDIFIAHNSPRRIHDKEDEVHYGFDALNEYIARAKPRVLIHGHQHVNLDTQVAGTRIIGVYGHRLVELPKH